MPDDEGDSVFVFQLDHRECIFQRMRDRLLDEDVLAVPASVLGERSVQLVRRRDDDGVDRGVVPHALDRIDGGYARGVRKRCTALRVRTVATGNLEPSIACGAREDLRPRARADQRSAHAVHCPPVPVTLVPPHTNSAWPVMKPASSSSRKATARAMSSGVPSRFTSTMSTTVWRCTLPGGCPRAQCLVSTGPGTTALTVIPSGPVSIATVRVMPMRPAFAVE